jgi:hypothetical protein
MRLGARWRSPAHGARRRLPVGLASGWGAGLVAAAMLIAPSRPLADPAGPVDAAVSDASPAIVDHATARAEPAPSARPSPAAGARTPVKSDAKAPEVPATAVEVTVRLIVEPHQNARVQWGAKDLGPPPLELRRPRGSGPLDVSVRCPGYLTVHTRLFTDHDDKLVVNLVPVSEAARVLGYRPPEVKPTRKTLP